MESGLRRRLSSIQLTCIDALLSGDQEHDLLAEWGDLTAEIIKLQDKSILSPPSSRESFSTASRIKYISSCILDLAVSHETIRIELEKDVAVLLDQSGSAAFLPASPPLALPSYSFNASLSYGPYRAYFLSNLSYPYPPPSTQKTLLLSVPSHKTQQLLNWFINTRNRSGWTSLYKTEGGSTKEGMEKVLEIYERVEERMRTIGGDRVELGAQSDFYERLDMSGEREMSIWRAVTSVKNYFEGGRDNIDPWFSAVLEQAKEVRSMMDSTPETKKAKAKEKRLVQSKKKREETKAKKAAMELAIRKAEKEKEASLQAETIQAEVTLSELEDFLSNYADDTPSPNSTAATSVYDDCNSEFPQLFAIETPNFQFPSAESIAFTSSKLQFGPRTTSIHPETLGIASMQDYSFSNGLNRAVLKDPNFTNFVTMADFTRLGPCDLAA